MSGFLAAIQQFFGGVVFWIVVQPWEQAIRVRAGRHVKRLAPGLHLRVPILDEVHKQAARLRCALIPTQTLCTADGQTLVVGATLGYAVADIEKLYRRLSHAEDTVSQLAAAAIAAEVFGRDRANALPQDVADAATAALRAELEPLGFSEVSLRVTDFAFVRAFRLIQEARWMAGRPLHTESVG